MSVANILSAISAKAVNVKPIGASLKFDLDGEFIHIDGTGDANIVSTDDKEADCVVSISPANLQALMTGDLNPTMAFMTGKVKVKGDLGVAMRMQSFL
jgi:putative sterol carrier protein